MSRAVLVADVAAVVGIVAACVAGLVLLRECSVRRRLACLLCPASQLAVVVFATVLYVQGEVGPTSAGVIAACSLGCPLLDIEFFRALVAAEQAGLVRQEVAAAREQYEAQLAHARHVRDMRASYQELVASASSTFGSVAGELAAGNVGEAARLLGLEEVALAPEHREPCDHVVAAALLTLYESRCAELGVRWDCDAQIPRNLPLPPVELSMVLSNLLSNAVDAAMRKGGSSPFAFVRVRARVSRGFLVLRVENSCAPGAQERSERRGDELPEHGWGRQIVATIARAHGGEVTDEVADGVWRTDVLVGLGNCLDDEPDADGERGAGSRR
ncbi:sensor histidine kinase [Thermophilibacter sp.]